MIAMELAENIFELVESITEMSSGTSVGQKRVLKANDLVRVIGDAIESAKRPIIQLPMEPPAPTPVTQPVELRDWFAGMAMQGIISIRNSIECHVVAELAYRQSDAMLAEREKG